MKALIHLYKNQTRILYPSKIAKEIDITYAYLLGTLNELDEAGFISYDVKNKLDNRSKQMMITEKGIKLCDLIQKFNDMGVTL